MIDETVEKLKTTGGLAVAIEVSKNVCFAMQQNGEKIIRSIAVRNEGEDEVRGIRLKLYSIPKFFEPAYFELNSLDIEEEHYFKKIKLAVDSDYLSTVSERIKTAVTVEVEVKGKINSSHTEYIDVSAFDYWPGLSSNPELIASFCMPSDPAVEGIISEAAGILKSENLAFDGYGAGDPNVINRQLAAIYSVIKSKNLTYSMPAASFEKTGQKIRLPQNLIDQGLGTCLDTAMLFCSCAEAVGLNPVVFLFNDHALCGFWLKDAIFQDTVNDDLSAVNKRMADGVSELTVLESTFCTDKNASFAAAVTSAKERLFKGSGFICYIDIARARKSGVLPLPFRYSDDGKYFVDREMYLKSREDTNSLNVLKTDLRSNGLKDRFEKWKRDLLDITLKNPLINYRLGRVGVPVINCGLANIGNAFFEGKALQLLHKPDIVKGEIDIIKDPALTDANLLQVLKGDLDGGVLRSALIEDDLIKRLTVLYRNEKTAVEETGANTLYLALGFLKWFEEDKPSVERFAPIALIPVEIRRGMGKRSYTLRMSDDECQVNLSLIEMLRVNFEIDASGLKEFMLSDEAFNLNAVLTYLRKLIMNQKGWDVLEAVSLGMFQFAKFVIWNDLKLREEQVRRHPLISAMIESKSVETYGVPPSLTDAKLYLPLSSDSSQTTAVEAAGEGKTFVLHGPPGTGKSQVITNIIANALAHKKKVLFVAEKIAALNVVKRRLDGLGISDFCVELHSNKSRKRDFFEQFDNVLELADNASDVNYPEAVYKLNAVNTELEVLSTALHGKRNAGFSVFEGLNKLIEYYKKEIEPVSVAVTDITGGEYNSGLETLSDCAVTGGALGEPVNSAFYGCDISDFNLAKKDRVVELCRIISDGYSLFTSAFNLIDGELKERLHPKHKDINNALYANIKDIDKTLGELIHYSNKNGFTKFFMSIFSKRYRKMKKSVYYKSLKAFLKEKPEDAKAAFEGLHTFMEAERELREILLYNDKFDAFDNFGAEIYMAGELYLNNIAALREYCEYNFYRFESAKYPQLTEITELLHTGKITAAEVVPVFLYSFFESFVKAEVYRDEYLKNFSPLAQGLRREKFKALTELVERLSAKEVYLKLAAELPNFRYASQSSSEPGILLKAVKSRGRGVSIRKILSRVPGAVSVIKPCMLMSPLSAAQYLPENYPEFDLVVFDEASQMLTCDAAGSIARGKAAVIVGDPNQLPPTTFFNAKTDEEDLGIELFDQESVLDDMLTLNVLQKRLLWHYRSEHESLIAFSNANYYDNSLITFPTPDYTKSRIEFKGVDGVYDRGTARTNRIEAAAVVDELFMRLKDPELSKLSYGVVTFNVAQQSLIQDMVDKRLLSEPELEPYFSREEEPVFIKNIESVQGDERDVIMFSITYGLDKNGKMAVNFGPVNKAGGHRRLNVAVTRAAKQMIVFSSITPDMIDISRTSSQGVEGLKNFLSYAIGNKLNANTVNISKDGSLFVSEIADELKKAGYKAVTNLGKSLNKIDIAVQDEKGKFILGILCDNEAMAQKCSVRDREYGNESILKRMGWKLTRVYALEWWQNKDAELRRLIEILEGGVPDIQDGVTADLEDLEAGHKEIKFNPNIPLPASEYKEAALPKSTQDEFYLPENRDELLKCIRAVLALESPVTEQRLYKKIAASYGITKMTQRFNEHLGAAIKKAGLTFNMTQNTKIYWPSKDNIRALEHFRTNSDRKADEIAKEEYAVAANYIIKNAISIGHDDLIRETANLFGFIKSPTASVRIDLALGQLIIDGKIAKDENNIYRAK